MSGGHVFEFCPPAPLARAVLIFTSCMGLRGWCLGRGGFTGGHLLT